MVGVGGGGGVGGLGVGVRGGGGVSMLHNTLHEQIYRAISIFMFYGRILNV